MWNTSYKSGLNPYFMDKPQLVKSVISGPLTESLVDSSVEEKEKVVKLIQESIPPDLELLKVKTVKNSFLESMYLLKKEEYKSRNGELPEEMLLFHVTSAKNVNSIISDNFDWRKVDPKRGKYGMGTCFSEDLKYANQHAKKDKGEDRVIIVTKVLISKKHKGHKKMEITQRNYDTAIGNLKEGLEPKVYVKFCDNEILPRYVVYYKSRSLGEIVKHTDKYQSLNMKGAMSLNQQTISFLSHNQYAETSTRESYVNHIPARHHLNQQSTSVLSHNQYAETSTRESYVNHIPARHHLNQQSTSVLSHNQYAETSTRESYVNHIPARHHLNQQSTSVLSHNQYAETSTRESHVNHISARQTQVQHTQNLNIPILFKHPDECTLKEKLCIFAIFVSLFYYESIWVAFLHLIFFHTYIVRFW